MGKKHHGKKGKKPVVPPIKIPPHEGDKEGLPSGARMTTATIELEMTQTLGQSQTVEAQLLAKDSKNNRRSSLNDSAAAGGGSGEGRRSSLLNDGFNAGRRRSSLLSEVAVLQVKRSMVTYYSTGHPKGF